MVGTNALCHVMVGKTNRGITVVAMWTKSRAMANLSHLGRRKATPINISNTPKNIINCPNVINGKVFDRRSETNGSAGLVPNTFRIPNQKKTVNITILAVGTLIFLKE